MHPASKGFMVFAAAGQPVSPRRISVVVFQIQHLEQAPTHGIWHFGGWKLVVQRDCLRKRVDDDTAILTLSHVRFDFATQFVIECAIDIIRKVAKVFLAIVVVLIEVASPLASELIAARRVCVR